MIRTTLAAILAAALFPAAAWAHEAALTRRAVELRDAPGDQGRTIASLAAQTPVTRTPQRQGAWVQVRTDGGATGWLHLFDVGPAATASASSGSAAGDALRSVANLFGGARPAQPATNAAGIRGLDSEDLARAQPNPGAVAQMEAARQSEAEARSFAGRSGWRPAMVDPLPAPARLSTQPAGNPGQPQSP